MKFKTKKIDKWRSPASEYPRSRIRSAAIRTAWYDIGYYHCYGVNGYNFVEATKRLYITTLTIDGKIWMVDDAPHWWAMEQHSEALSGHVLCAGLGLGLMVHAMNANPNITHITVVERSADVIDLIGPLVPHDKLTIINEDFYELSTDAIAPVDSVLFDLFVGNGEDFFTEAIFVTYEILKKWDSPQVRVHGLQNPLIEQLARAKMDVPLAKLIEKVL